MRKRSLLIVGLVVIAFAVNVSVLLNIGGRLFVTYAELPPQGIACPACDAPDVQKALARAAAYGRSQIQSGSGETLIWLAVALLLINVAVPLAVWRLASAPRTV